ncbi:MarR family winged helix-turn-helix transcriptional regulator [Roseiarcaceae bacterium H3SJ34-1]|uniref:MarR family winged helix-turn-helix transcriptional regulator n=1 Tax=Terripilifer ovatus TaxID=3032367 RepID=UPI003AB9B184|nr:MarR family winged helix-turn-helix transcriptional regulator [Roseiarcaceae bacterium H3SJ34-1]
MNSKTHSEIMRPVYNMPAHLVRRLQQVTQAIFEAEAGSFGITSAQFAILQTVSLLPGLEQREVAAAAGYDSVTTSQIIRKLEVLGLLRRNKGSRSRRGQSVHLTEEGVQALTEIRPAIDRIQARLIERLPEEKRTAFLQLLSEITDVDNSHRAGTSRSYK